MRFKKKNIPATINNTADTIPANFPIFPFLNTTLTKQAPIATSKKINVKKLYRDIGTSF